jgi:hypothetical protein
MDRRMVNPMMLLHCVNIDTGGPAAESARKGFARIDPFKSKKQVQFMPLLAFAPTCVWKSVVLPKDRWRGVS